METVAAINLVLFPLAGLLFVGAYNKMASAIRILEEARSMETRARLKGRR